jgi:membrane associated rhomboid family serine protease
VAGAVAHVHSAQQIAVVPPVKYYLVDDICIDAAHAFGQPDIEATGKHNETLSMNLYVIVPLCWNGPLPKRAVWIALRFTDSISQRASDAEKQSRYETFLNSSDKAVFGQNAKSYRYLATVGRNMDRRHFESLLEQRGVELKASPVIVVPHTEPFDERASGYFPWMIGTFLTCLAVWTAMVMWAPLRRRQAAVSRAIKKDREENALFRGLLLLPSKRNYGLPLLMDVNLLVFACMVFAGLGLENFQTPDILAWGANYGPMLHGLGWFRLISNQFVHAGAMHLADNLYGLVFAGLLLLPVATNARLIVCYLVCGLGASLASTIVHPAIVSTGASGAIFGLYGIVLALAALRDARVAAMGSIVWINAGIFAGLNLLLGVFMPGIDNAAHMGGLVTGLLVGALLHVLDQRQLARR